MVEYWELVLRELYKQDPELSNRKTATKLDTKKLAKQLGIEDKDLALHLSALEKQGLIKKNRNKLNLTKKGVHYHLNKHLKNQFKTGIFIFTTALIITTIFNFINWLRVIDSWILLGIYLSIMFIFGILTKVNLLNS